MYRSYTLKLIALAAILITILPIYAQVETIFTAPLGEQKFGKSVAISNNWAIVGSTLYRVDSTIDNTGKIFVYHRNENNQWSQSQTIQCQNTDTDGNIKFGYSVAISGKWAFIGAPMLNFTDSGIDYCGIVYKYELTSDSLWTYRGMLPQTNNTASSHFGCSISMKGNMAAVLADEDPGNPGNNGRVFTYKYDINSNNWSYDDFQQVNGTTGGLEFGQQISLQYPYVIVGTPGTNNIHIVDFSESDQNVQEHQTTTDYESGFGENVAISGTTVLIGSNVNTHRYELNNNALVQHQTIIDPTNPQGTQVGGIALNDKYIIMSSSYPNYTPTTKVSIFKRGGNSICATLDIPELISGNIMISDPHIIVGSYRTLIAEYKFQNVRIALTLDGGLTDIENTTVKFTNHATGQQNEYHPDINGISNTPFFHDKNGTYHIEIRKAGYYTYMLGDVVINANNNDVAYNVNLLPVGNQVNVSHTLPNAFSRIQAAVDYAIANNKTQIKIHAGTYREDIDLSNLPATSSFTMEGICDSTIVKGNVYANLQNMVNQLSFDNLIFECFQYSGIANLKFSGEIGHVSFTDCTFRNYDKAAALTAEVPITISSCEFYNNLGAAVKISSTSAIIENCSIHDNAGAFGGALHANAATSISIKDCTFQNNRSTGTGDIIVGTPGGAVYLQNCSNILIENNQFIGNITSGSSGPLDITMTTPNSTVGFKIRNNKFINNVPIPIGGINYRGAIGMSFQGCQFTSQDSISYNFIKSTSCPNEFMIAGENCSGQLYVNNCDFIMDTNTESGAIIRTYSTLSTRFESCLFQTGQNNAVFAAVIGPGSNTVIHNEIYRSLFNRGYQIVNGPLPSPLINYYNTTNVSDMYLDSNYVPKWDAIDKSPCIDMGNPYKYDPDGTPSDIGCYRAFDHSYESYKFADMDPDKYYWICFPVLDTMTNNENLASNFFEELLITYQNESDITVPEYLDKIIWMDTDQPQNIDWIPGYQNIPGSWTDNVSTHAVTSERGYKIKLEGARARTFTESGLLADPQAAITLTPGENWIGYTLKNSSSPEDAFASIWDDLTMIKTRDWCMSRIQDNLWLSSSKQYPLNYGDMVVLTCNSNHTAFHWGDPDLTIEDKKPEAEHFEFPEKEDYFPVYINLNNVNMVGLQEIGLLMNSACKGAVVVTDSLVQLNAFLDVNEVLTADNTEFVFYYEAKNQPQEMKTVRVTSSMLQKSYIDGNEAYPVYQINIKGTDFDVPVNFITTLNQNFPNPFNPTTTISFCLKEDCKATLDIYNIRGQLVKTLQSGFVTKGKHSVVWNGKDDSGNACASGVYFYRLTAQDKTVTKKMLMLK